MIFGLETRSFRAFRKSLGLSQATVADLAGIAQSKISAVESGKANPELGTINAICAALDAELILVPRRIGGDVRGLVDRHFNRRRHFEAEPMSVREELFIPDGDD